MDSNDDFEANAQRATATIRNLRFQRARVNRRRGPHPSVFNLRGLYFLPPLELAMPLRHEVNKIICHMEDGYGYPTGCFSRDRHMTPVPLKVPLHFNEQQFKEWIRGKYWRLQHVDFTLHMKSEGRTTTPLPDGHNTPQYLKSLNASGYMGVLVIKQAQNALATPQPPQDCFIKSEFKVSLSGGPRAPLTVRIFDSGRGCAARGVPVYLAMQTDSGDTWQPLEEGVTNSDGTACMLYHSTMPHCALYKLEIDSATYFLASGQDGCCQKIEVGNVYILV